MKINIFRNSAKFPEHQQVLTRFYNGVKIYSDNVIINNGFLYQPCDIAVFFGSWKNRPKRAHHVLKMDIMNKHLGDKIIIETPLLFRTLVDTHSFYRIGLNHFLADEGDFKNKNSSSTRYNYLREKYDFSVKDWRTTGENIILALQLPGDASLRGLDIHKWAEETLVEIQKYTDRKIIIRPHPLDRTFMKGSYIKYPNVIVRDLISSKENNDLSNAWCTVTYTSGYAIDSIIGGVPTIACDTGNFAYELMKNNTFDRIESLEYPDRTQWFYDMAYTTWHLDEIEQGLPWKHLMEVNKSANLISPPTP